MAMEIRKKIIEKGQEIRSGREGIMDCRVKVGRKRWRIIGVYVHGNMEGVLKDMEEWLEEKKVGNRILISGDFNARTGREREAVKEEEEGESGGEKGRKSKDEKVNREGRKLVELIEEKGWSIFNGNMSGDKKGEFTFTGGKGCTVIDYLIGNEDVKGRIKRMRIGDRIDSDHHSVEIWAEGRVVGKRKGERREDAGRVR